MEKPTEAAVSIVGGGPSGLATAAYLRHLSIPYTLLERENCFASLWQKYAYDRVHLHLTKQFCQLPLMPFPAAYPTFISRQHFIHYLNDYVSRFDIRPTYRRLVEAAAYDGAAGEWLIEARNSDSGEVEEYRSRFLVVATGETCDARIPVIEGLGSFNGEVLHSTNYINGEKFAGKTVLVVGSGKTSIVVRSPIHIVSRATMHLALVLLNHLPLKWVDPVAIMMSKIVYGDLSKYGIKRPNEGPFALKVKRGRFRIIKGNNVLSENEEEHTYDVLIFATGFKRSTKQWLKGDNYLLNEDGLPKSYFPNHWKGKNGRRAGPERTVGIC